MRLLIFGNSGSGKTSFARAVAASHRLPHLDLDSIVWEPHQVAVQRPSQDISDSLRAFLASKAAWVIEGCYGELIEAASHACTELHFLNPGLEMCLLNNQRRPWEPSKYSSLSEQNAMLPALQAWVSAYYTRGDSWSYREHRRIFDAFLGAKTEHTCPTVPLSGTDTALA